MNHFFDTASAYSRCALNSVDQYRSFAAQASALQFYAGHQNNRSLSVPWHSVAAAEAAEVISARRRQSIPASRPRRRYADARAAALLTGRGAGEWARHPLACGTRPYAQFCCSIGANRRRKLSCSINVSFELAGNFDLPRCRESMATSSAARPSERSRASPLTGSCGCYFRKHQNCVASGIEAVWRRTRSAPPFARARRRVRRVMRENGLLAPHRVGHAEAKPHDVITDKVNEMWGTDMTQTNI